MRTPPDAVTLLRDGGLRVTRPRTAVIDALRRTPHADVETISSDVRQHLGKVSKQAIYDVLNALDGAGIVRRIEPAGHPGLFELRVGDNHHHLVCTECGAIEDVDCVIGAAPCLTPSDDHGYVIRVAEVTFWGSCSACAAQLST